MQLSASPIDYARGAEWHLRQGLDQYHQLEIERGSWLGNPEKVRAFESRASFELAWAASDLDSALPAIGARDGGLAGSLAGTRDLARDLAARIAQHKAPITPPFALEQGHRDSWRAVELLQG